MALKAPRVLLAWDDAGADAVGRLGALRAGAPLRNAGDRRPLSAHLDRIDLDDFDVIVLPSGTYAPLAGEESLRRLRDWIRGGGTLVTIAEASRWAAGERVNLLETRTELRGGRPETEPAPHERAASELRRQGSAGGASSGSRSGGARAHAPPPFDYDKSIQPERERPENTPGAILRVTIDQEHWLSVGPGRRDAGAPRGPARLHADPARSRTQRGRLRGQGRLVASGLVWDEARDQLAQKAYLIHQPLGQGHVIAFAEDPNYRAFTEASQLLFINAVLLGPSR